MKKVNVMLSGILMFMSVGVFAQNTTDKLPATAQEFISQHFSSATIKEVQENSSWQIWEDEKYEVRFANGIEVDFDKNGNVLEIDGHKNVTIPVAALPSEIVSYLQSNYPDAKVVSWDKQDKGQEVELMDGTELEFDQDGSFLKID
ncbi:hypothetical protein GCM10007103_14100 [Salinimicrobium marinum]|uniref:Putative beta-lactamase-inhibitor-like PepSY-like domain-containing protein n=1 Tax=Salinimicrobium marinum TaxID=680283 RepID=A0A918SDX9_9FLAO|nr:PepSY-like domain-containing protein [Salinimicrobium marinum]GHA33727.1 hypothetical protein GCM10007103_14100 [Salinimicrobium marinum]